MDLRNALLEEGNGSHLSCTLKIKDLSHDRVHLPIRCV